MAKRDASCKARCLKGYFAWTSLLDLKFGFVISGD